jgi:hypothetical protein
MSEHEPLDTVLPPDLAEIERLLREPAAAPPPELLSRIEASRDLGVVVERMMLAEEEFSARGRRQRTIFGMAAAAVLLVGAFGVLSRMKTRTGGPATPLTAARAPQPANAPRATVTERVPTSDEFTRLLTPWPNPVNAQVATTLDRRYARSASLTPQFKANVYNERRIFSRVIVSPKGQRTSTSRLEWELANIHWNDTRYAPTLIARRFADSSDVIAECDTVVLGRQLNLWQRRLHRAGYERYFLFDEAFRLVQVADSAALLRYRNTPKLTPAPGEQLWTGVPVQYYRKLSGRHSLAISEAHLALLLRTVPLWRDWETTVAIPTEMNYIAPKFDEGVMGLRVTGVDTLTTKVGVVTAYRMTLDYGRIPDIWWIDTHTGGLVKSIRPLINGYQEVTTLESVQRPR